MSTGPNINLNRQDADYMSNAGFLQLDTRESIQVYRMEAFNLRRCICFHLL